MVIITQVKEVFFIGEGFEARKDWRSEESMIESSNLPGDKTLNKSRNTRVFLLTLFLIKYALVLKSLL